MLGLQPHSEDNKHILTTSPILQHWRAHAAANANLDANCSSVKGQEVNVADTSNGSCETVTNQIGWLDIIVAATARARSGTKSSAAATLCLARKTSYKNFIPGHRRKNHKTSTKDHQEDLTRIPLRIREKLSYKHQCLKRNSTRSRQDLLLKTCTRSCKDFLENFTRISARSSHKGLKKTLTKIF